jgi:IS5 family transposase
VQNINPENNWNEAHKKRVSLSTLFDDMNLQPCWSIVRKRYDLNGWTRTLDWEAMFKALILKEMWRIGSRRKLVRLLEKDNRLLSLCGFAKPPDQSTFSKFVKRIGPDIFTELFKDWVKQLAQSRELGRVVAIDSTIFQAYARDWKIQGSADPDAQWGYSATKKTFVFGYKVHLACDAESELPLVFTVTPANVYDSTVYLDLLDRLKKIGIRPEVVLADAGYDSKENVVQTLERFGADPIIAPNRRKAKTEKERDWERCLRIKRDTKEWRQLYNKRGSIERVFSRLKEELDLKSVKVRGLPNVKTHVTFSLMTMLLVALGALKSEKGALSTSISAFRY